MASHRAHVISILRCAIIVGEGSSRLGVLLRGLPLLLFDMFLATKTGS
jgi:hypothetical protein